MADRTVRRELPDGWRKWIAPWTVGYQRRWLRTDLLAGLVIGAVLIPQGMAYAQLAGMPAVTGLYATIAGIIAYSIFGSSRQLVLGPESSTSTLIAAVLVSVAGVGASADREIALAGMLAIMMGVFLLVGGLLRLGIIASFLSKPVLVGYLNGLALIIIVGQVPRVFGYSSEGDEFFDEQSTAAFAFLDAVPPSRKVLVRFTAEQGHIAGRPGLIEVEVDPRSEVSPWEFLMPPAA